MRKSDTSAVELVNEIIRKFVIENQTLPSSLSVEPHVFAELFIEGWLDESTHLIVGQRLFTYRGIPIAIAKNGVPHVGEPPESEHE